MDETNLLSLIKPWLDTNYQITTKIATVAFRKIFQELNQPLPYIAAACFSNKIILDDHVPVPVRAV
jgi:hypothetical protein